MRKSLLAQLDAMGERLKMLFMNFIKEMLTPHIFRMMESGELPSTFATDLVTVLETMATRQKPLLQPARFANIVEFLAQMIAQQYAEILAGADAKWTPELIWRAGQNWGYIVNWPALIALPSARKHVEGLTKGFQLLISNQLQSTVADPKFASKMPDLPFDLMVAILQRYNEKAKSKELYVISGALVKTCIQKFTPHCKRPPAAVKRK
jgi:hypothetical protein